jgi:hypothetical protein
MIMIMSIIVVAADIRNAHISLAFKLDGSHSFCHAIPMKMIHIALSILWELVRGVGFEPTNSYEMRS